MGGDNDPTVLTSYQSTKSKKTLDSADKKYEDAWLCRCENAGQDIRFMNTEVTAALMAGSWLVETEGLCIFKSGQKDDSGLLFTYIFYRDIL